MATRRALFEDADFAIDEDADEYRALHPNAGLRAKARSEEQRLLQEHFEEVGHVRVCACVCMCVYVCAYVYTCMCVRSVRQMCAHTALPPAAAAGARARVVCFPSSCYAIHYGYEP